MELLGEVSGSETTDVVKKIGRGRGRMKAMDLFSPTICFPVIAVNELEPVQEKGPATVTKTSLENTEIHVASSLGVNGTGESLKTPSTSKTDPLPESTGVSKVDPLSSEAKHPRGRGRGRGRGWIREAQHSFFDDDMEDSLQVQSPPYRPIPEDIAPQPEDFKGTLLAGEEWRYCPYNKLHKFVKPDHLIICRARYIKECKIERKPIVIRICPFDSKHHVHMDRLKEHEANCPNRHLRPRISFIYGMRTEGCDDRKGQLPFGII